MRELLDALWMGIKTMVIKPYLLLKNIDWGILEIAGTIAAILGAIIAILKWLKHRS